MNGEVEAEESEFAQDQALINLLFERQTCPHLPNFAVEGSTDTCTKAIYAPAKGHVPRAFGGATGELKDVKIAIVSNGPTTPICNETYTSDANANLQTILGNPYLRKPPQPFHKNLNAFIDMLISPDDGSLEDRLKQIWVTNSLHCTFSNEPEKTDRLRCGRFNLFRHLRLFTNVKALVLAGTAVQGMVKPIRDEFPDKEIVCCHSFSPRDVDRAQSSWQGAAKRCQEYLSAGQ